VTFHDDNVRKAKALPRDELERLVVEAWDRADDRRLRKEATDEDLRRAEAELDGIELARLFEMPTVLDAQVRVDNDDGGGVWKHRDEATFKDHHAFNDRMETLHERAAGIRRRKNEKLDAWADTQGVEFDHGAPIGEQVWRDTKCAICGKGYLPGDPFEMAHDIAVILGGGNGTTQWAHRTCNRAEGVG
jgi:hypothetical protein